MARIFSPSGDSQLQVGTSLALLVRCREDLRAAAVMAAQPTCAPPLPYFWHHLLALFPPESGPMGEYMHKELWVAGQREQIAAAGYDPITYAPLSGSPVPLLPAAVGGMPGLQRTRIEAAGVPAEREEEDDEVEVEEEEAGDDEVAGRAPAAAVRPVGALPPRPLIRAGPGAPYLLPDGRPTTDESALVAAWVKEQPWVEDWAAYAASVGAASSETGGGAGASPDAGARGASGDAVVAPHRPTTPVAPAPSPQQLASAAAASFLADAALARGFTSDIDPKVLASAMDAALWAAITRGGTHPAFATKAESQGRGGVAGAATAGDPARAGRAGAHGHGARHASGEADGGGARAEPKR